MLVCLKNMCGQKCTTIFFIQNVSQEIYLEHIETKRVNNSLSASNCASGIESRTVVMKLNIGITVGYQIDLQCRFKKTNAMRQIRGMLFTRVK